MKKETALHPQAQICAWRVISRITSVVNLISDSRFELFNFSEAVVHGIAHGNWSEFIRELEEMIAIHREPKYGTPPIREFFEPPHQHLFSGTVLEGPEGRVELTPGIVMQVTRLERRKVQLTFTCAGDQELGNDIRRALSGYAENIILLPPTVEYGNDLLVRSNIGKEHWIFGEPSIRNLGRRFDETDRLLNEWATYRIFPLENEKLWIYQGTAAEEIGLPIDNIMPRHPDPEVFASVGPISLGLKKGQKHRGKPARDRIVAFHDKHLPLRSGSAISRLTESVVY